MPISPCFEIFIRAHWQYIQYKWFIEFVQEISAVVAPKWRAVRSEATRVTRTGLEEYFLYLITS